MDYNQFNLNPLRLQSLYENYGMSAPGGDGGIQQTPFALDTGPSWDSQVVDPHVQYDRFNQSTQAPPAPTAPTVQSGRVTPNYIELMEQMYHPETQATERFEDLINRFPQQERPSLGRALVASGIGLGRGQLENSQKFLNMPYVRDVAAWKEQAGPAYNAANLERQANMNERQLASQFAQHQVTSDKNEAAALVAKQKADNDTVRAEAYAMKQNGYDLDFSGPFVIATKPGQLPKVTSIPTGKMSDNDKIILQGDQRVRQTEAAGGQARQTAAVVGEQARQTEGVRQEGRVELRGMPLSPRSTPVGPESEMDKTRRINNTFRQLWDTDPEAREHIVRNGNNFELGPPPSRGLFSGNSAAKQQKYDQVKEALYPSLNAALGGGTRTPAPAQQTRPQSNAQPQNAQPWIKKNRATGQQIVSYDGGETWQPYSGK